MISPPPSFSGSFKDFFTTYIEPCLPKPTVVEQFHRGLQAYFAGSNPVFFLRHFHFNADDRWRLDAARRKPTLSRAGRIAWTDNSPQWVIHSLGLQELLPRPEEIGQWLETTMHCHVHDVDRRTTLDNFGWHAAHIFDVKDGNTRWKEYDRAELLRRSFRNIHPFNMVPLPKSEWMRLGKQTDLLQFALSRYQERYGAIVNEAVTMMQGSFPVPVSTKPPSIAYAPAVPPASPSHAVDDDDVLHLKETDAGRIHVHNFGARYGGVRGEKAFTVVVSLRNGTQFGPVKGVRINDLFTRMDILGKHYVASTYFRRDLFFIEGSKLVGGSAVTVDLALRLNRTST